MGDEEERPSGWQTHVPVRDRIGQQLLEVLRNRSGAGSTQAERLAEINLAFELADAALAIFDVGPQGQLILKPRIESGTWQKE